MMMITSVVRVRRESFHQCRVRFGAYARFLYATSTSTTHPSPSGGCGGYETPPMANRRRRRPSEYKVVKQCYLVHPPTSTGRFNSTRSPLTSPGDLLEQCLEVMNVTPPSTTRNGHRTTMPVSRRSASVQIRALHSKEESKLQPPPGTSTEAATVSSAGSLLSKPLKTKVPSTSKTGSSACSESLVLRILGPRWSAYGHLARLDKPAGALLLLYPCWWGVALATPMGSFPDVALLAVFATSAFVMRSAGCTINDMWDRGLDRKVARTHARPLASGELNTVQAVIFLGAQLGLGLCGLLTLNVECVKLGFAAMPLVIVYPLMKRYTDWPQLVLGLTFNWGTIIGWTAVHGSISWPHVLPLYTAGVCWTLVYDTLYGHQDKKDDKKLGIRSTALLFGDSTKPILAGFGTASMGLIGAAGYATGLSWPFYVGTAMAAGHLGRQIVSADLKDPEGLFRIFKSNHQFGALVFASIVAGHWQF